MRRFLAEGTGRHARTGAIVAFATALAPSDEVAPQRTYRQDRRTAVPRKIVDQILPTTMIGSYPKPRWYTRYNLQGQDLLEWWKLEENYHAYWDATTACIKDQELAGLDIVSDGQMHFDDYGGGIGSFVWYWYERLGGFTNAKLPNPLARQLAQADDADLSQVAWMHNWGGTTVTEKVSRGIPGRLADMYGVARMLTDKPIKVSVGAGP